MKLVLERDLAAPPETVWPLLTVPDRMCEWSEARIVLVERGADGGEASAGSRRRAVVRAFGLSTTLEETVVACDPPRRHVYRVTSGGGLRGHEGVITLTPGGAGTLLRWEVTFGSVVPGMDRVLGKILAPRLGRSLDVLAQQLRAAPRGSSA